jgi:hypothetical protein
LTQNMQFMQSLRSGDPLLMLSTVSNQFSCTGGLWILWWKHREMVKYGQNWSNHAKSQEVKRLKGHENTWKDEPKHLALLAFLCWVDRFNSNKLACALPF